MWILLASGLTSQSEVPNPEYEAWKSFKPGSWVRAAVRATRRTGMQLVEQDVTTTLIEVRGDRIVVEEQSQNSEPSRREIPRLTMRVQETLEKEGVEQVTVGDKKISCRWRLVDLKGIKTRTWRCRDVPGGVVRIETANSASEAMKRVFEVKEWK
jgi:hypothetical protein